MTGFQMNNKKQAGSLAVVPRHIAIIMDGNNRWARKRLMPGVAGHKAGVDAVKAMIEVCVEEAANVGRWNPPLALEWFSQAAGRLDISDFDTIESLIFL